MNKDEIISGLIEGGVIAVIRAHSQEQGQKLCAACLKGGINALEVTFTVPGAKEIIASLALKDHPSFFLGAGTVLDAATAKAAINAGAQFIVSPIFDQATSDLCALAQVPYLPGCLTPTEIYKAMTEGAAIIKVFPGSAVDPSYFKAIHGPLPEARLMPTGGVSLDNVAAWIKAGAVAIGAGGALTEPGEKGDYAEVTRRAKEFVWLVKEAREAK